MPAAGKTKKTKKSTTTVTKKGISKIVKSSLKSLKQQQQHQQSTNRSSIRNQRRKALIDNAADANEILHGLWLGNEDAALSKNFIVKHNIKAVINATNDVPLKFQRSGIQYIRVPLDDSLKMIDINKMTDFLPYVIQKVYQLYHDQHKNILIHCHAGMQRSAAIVASYLVQHRKLTPDKAIKFVIRKRPVAFLGGESINFEKSIQDFHNNLKKFGLK